MARGPLCRCLLSLLFGVLAFAQLPRTAVNIDEANNWRTGWSSAQQYLVPLGLGADELPEIFNADHPPFLELVMYFAERVLGLRYFEDPGAVHLLRHGLLATIFGVSGLLFFDIVRWRTASSLAGFLGAVAYLFHPRIFHHAFHNNYDVGFLAATVFVAYALMRCLRAGGQRHLILLGIALGIAVDIRIFGVVYAPLAALAVIALICRERKRLIEAGLPFLKVTISCAITVYACWPYLWPDFFGRLLDMLLHTSQQPNAPSILLMNGFLTSTWSLQWYFNMVWVGVTTPIPLLVGMVLGGACMLRSWTGGMAGKQEKVLLDIWVIATATLGLVIPIILQSVLFDSWRHHFFCYAGMVYVLSILGSHLGGGALQWRVRIAFLGAAACSGVFAVLSFFPHSFAYFNRFAGPPDTVHERWDVDYWMMGALTALNRLAHYRDGPLLIQRKWGVSDMVPLLSADLRSRVQMTTAEEADYLITNYRFYEYCFNQHAHFFEIRENGIFLVAVRSPMDSEIIRRGECPEPDASSPHGRDGD